MTQQINIIKMIAAVVFSSLMMICMGNCTDKEKNTAELSKEIMSIHDSAMSKMSYIFRLRKEIAHQIENSSSTVSKDSLNRISYQLSKANKDMMQWMHAYKEPELSNDSALTYLYAQHKSITMVSSQINTAIANAEQLLKHSTTR